jgi:hypothetical protein
MGSWSYHRMRTLVAARSLKDELWACLPSILLML